MVQESTNTFSDGLISDLSSLTTPNTVLTDALNATLLTFNGNELVLQNDMGNTKIMVPGTELDPEYVQLPEGFIPLGMKEHGGVLYIVSTNGQQIEIGSFPSLPEGDNEEILIHIIDDIKLGDDGVDLNKNFIISDKLNSGEKFLIVLNTENLGTISEFNGIKKYYKPKLLSIEKGIETDITNTLKLQKKYNSSNGLLETSKHWFLSLNDTEYTNFNDENYIFNKNNYITNAEYQIFKPKKGGTLALRFELETINSFTLENLEIVGNDLKFDFKIFGDSLIKPNKIKLDYSFIDISTGIQSSIDTINNTSIDFTLNGTPTSIATPFILVPLANPTLNLNRLIEFTATCENTTYGINFDKFVIKRLVDLSKESLNWTPTISYKVENVAYTVGNVTTKIVIGKYGNINGVITPMDRYNQLCNSSENQAAYYWNLLPDRANNTLITNKKYDIVGTFAINSSTKKAETPITIGTNENRLSSSNPNNLPQGVLVTTIQYGYLYNPYVLETNKLIKLSSGNWRIPTLSDINDLDYWHNFDAKNLLTIGVEWDNLGTNLNGLNIPKVGYIDNTDRPIFINNGYSYYNEDNSGIGTVNITLNNNVIENSLIQASDNQGSCIRLCSDVGGNYIDEDGTTYTSVLIGNLYWLTEDLRTTKYNDGQLIDLVEDLQEWDGMTTAAYTTRNITLQ